MMLSFFDFSSINQTIIPSLGCAQARGAVFVLGSLRAIHIGYQSRFQSHLRITQMSSSQQNGQNGRPMLLYVSDIIFAVLIVSDIFAGYIRKIGKPVKKRLAINTSSCTMKQSYPHNSQHWHLLNVLLLLIIQN